MMVCLLGLVVGCSSSTQPAQKSSSSSSSSVKEIKLNSEELEYNGIHVRVPDSLQLDKGDDGSVYSVNNLNEPITGEVSLALTFESAEEWYENRSRYDSSIKAYTPAAVLIDYAKSGSDDKFTVEKKHIAGTDAYIQTWTEDSYEYTSINLILNSGIVKIRYGDRGGKYGDLIQESIDTIRIDENIIPEIARATSPEGLKAAGLREQPWEIECASMPVYMNMPEDFTLVKRSNGTYVWVAPDGQTMVQASITKRDSLLLDEAEFASILSGSLGLEEFDYFQRGMFHGMYFTEFKYEQKDSASGKSAWAHVAIVLPWLSDQEALQITVVSTSEEEVEMDAMMSTVRIADGWNNGGVLDLESIAESE